MIYKFFVYCPDETKVINEIIKVASDMGAGIYDHYSQVAFITHGEGNWKPVTGARPYQGTVGETTRADVAKIEMICLSDKVKQIKKAIKQIHPWEQVDIEFVRIEEIKREEDIISKAGKPVARPTTYLPSEKKRKPGMLKGKIVISDDFNDESEEINKLFYGK